MEKEGREGLRAPGGLGMIDGQMLGVKHGGVPRDVEVRQFGYALGETHQTLAGYFLQGSIHTYAHTCAHP
eukprot:734527-Pyramimonas_sp.AAC.1